MKHMQIKFSERNINRKALSDPNFISCQPKNRINKRFLLFARKGIQKDGCTISLGRKGWDLCLDIGHSLASRVPKIGWTAGEVVTSGWLVATYRSIMPQSATYHGTFTRALYGSYLNDTATANGNESTVGIVFKVIRFVWECAFVIQQYRFTVILVVSFFISNNTFAKARG